MHPSPPDEQRVTRYRPRPQLTAVPSMSLTAPLLLRASVAAGFARADVAALVPPLVMAAGAIGMITGAPIGGALIEAAGGYPDGFRWLWTTIAAVVAAQLLHTLPILARLPPVDARPELL